MPTPYELWLADKKKREQEAARNAVLGKVNFKEASTASRPQYTLPGYQGKSDTKNYEWESQILSGIKAKGVGRSNNDKFDYVTKRLGLSPGQSQDFRNFLDFQQDSKQTIKTNKDGSVSKNQNVRMGQGAQLKNSLMDNIFSNMNLRQKADTYQKSLVPVQKVDQGDKIKNFFGWNYNQEQNNYLQAKKMGLNPNKPITKDAWEKARNKALQKTANATTGEGNGLYQKINGEAQRIGNNFWEVFGHEFNQGDTAWQQKNAIDELKKDPTNKKAISELQSINTYNRPAKNNTEKALDFIGRAGGELAPYTLGGGGAYGAADSLLTKLGLQSIKKPIVKDLVRGAIAGTIAGTEKAASKKALSNEDPSLKNIAFEAGMAGGGDAALGAFLRNINLKGQMNQLKDQLKESLGYHNVDEQTFKQALEEAFGQKGNVSNVLADAPKTMPKPFEPMVKGLKLPPRSMDSFVPNEIPKVDVPPAHEEWFNFGQNGVKQNGRGPQQANVGRYTKEMIAQQGDNILNRADALKNAPEGGYNQRLLDVQKGMHSNKQSIEQYQKEFDDAVNQQYEYLKNSMGKGTQPGGLIMDREGYVTGAYGRVSNNPKWYQDFYQHFGRKPTNEELRQLAESHVKNGFHDEFGSVPAWKPKDLQDIENQMDEVHALIQEHPNNQSLHPILKALEEDHAAITNGYQKALGNNPSTIEELYNSSKLGNDPQSFDELIKLAEMEHNAGSQPKNLKKMLHGDPSIREALQQLNALGGKSKYPDLPESFTSPNNTQPVIPNESPKPFSGEIPDISSDANDLTHLLDNVPKSQHEQDIFRLQKQLESLDMDLQIMRFRGEQGTHKYRIASEDKRAIEHQLNFEQNLSPETLQNMRKKELNQFNDKAAEVEDLSHLLEVPKTPDMAGNGSEIQKDAFNPPPQVPNGKIDEFLHLLNPAAKTETITPNGMKLNIPEVKTPQHPLEKLREFLNGGKKMDGIKSAANKDGSLLLSLKDITGEPPLKTVKTSKAINKMTPEELQAVYKQLEDSHNQLASKGKMANPKQLKALKEDMERVNEYLLNLNLQTFGKGSAQPKENPFDMPYQAGDTLPDTRTHIGTKTEKSSIQLKPLADKAYIKTVDNLHRLDQFDKEVENVLGRELKPSESTHTLGLNSRGSDQISKQILTQNMVDKAGNVVGKSLKEITMKVPKGKLKDFEDYLINQHAITRMERGEKVFPDEMEMTIGKSQEIVKNYEVAHPEFKDIAKDYYEYNKQLGEKWLVDTGILSEKQWEGYLEANPYYVPNNRIFSDLERPLFYGVKKGFANQSNPVKKAIGSQRKIVSPIESTIEHTAQYIKTAKRNEVMQTLINNIKQDPEAFKNWAEIVQTEKTPQSVLETLNKEGVDGVLDEFNKGFEQKPDLTKGNIVRGLIDGQPVHVKVHDPALLDALTNLNPKAQNVVIHALGQVTRFMKNLTTGINPVFSLTRNIWRDIPTAYVNSKSTNNPFVFAKDLVGSVVSVVKNDELYRSFKAVGGGHSSPISSDVNLLAQSKRSILPREKGLWNGTKHVGGKILGGLENLNNAVEAAPRLAEFKRIAKNGDYDSMIKGLYEANDVTVNFNKYGNVAKEIDAVIPYFNAAVQGLDKTGRTLLNPKTAPIAITKAFAAITIPSIIDFAVNHNNPDYQKLSNFIKDNNIVIPKGDGTFYKIPVPRELGVIFHSGVTRVLRTWVDQDPKAFEGFAENLLTNFSLPTRSILAPFNDLRSNKNFMDAPIVPGDLQNVSPQYQFDSKTSELSKKIGSVFGISPIQADYIIKSYGGAIGELGIPLNNKNGSILDTLKQKITADPVFSNDIQSDFYKEKTKLDQAHNDLVKQGVKSKNLNEELRKMFSKKSLEMSKIRKQMKEVQNDSKLSSNERLQQLRLLQDKINQIAESANQPVR